MIQALIFDFDGLILDTETPEFQAWQEIYREHGHELSLSAWSRYIGVTRGPHGHLADLEMVVGQPIDREGILESIEKRERELLATQPILPGVEALIADAKQLRLRLGVASSSDREWVIGHLSRLGLLESFDAIKTADDVANTKPDPELFLAALGALSTQAEEAIALEDSPNGVLAAQRAGIFCVAVPNPITRQLDLSHADLLLDSLADMPLEELLSTIQNI